MHYKTRTIFQSEMDRKYFLTGVNKPVQAIRRPVSYTPVSY